MIGRCAACVNDRYRRFAVSPEESDGFIEENAQSLGADEDRSRAGGSTPACPGSGIGRTPGSGRGAAIGRLGSICTAPGSGPDGAAAGWGVILRCTTGATGVGCEKTGCVGTG